MKQNKNARIFDNWIPKILSLVAAGLLFYLYNVSKYETRVLVLPLEISIADTLAPVNRLPGTIKVTVKGEPNVIYSMPESDIRASINASSYNLPGKYRLPIRIEKRGVALSASFLEFSIEPLDVEIDLDKKVSKRVPVNPVFGTELPENYEVINVQIQPSEAEIVCPETLSASITKLDTESISVSPQEGVYSYRARLSAPADNVLVNGVQYATVLWEVKKIIVYKTFQDVPVQIRNLQDNLELTGDVPTVSIKVSGLRLDIESLVLTDGLILVNLQDITEPGVYSVALETNFRPTIRVESVLPAVVSIRVVKRRDKL
mgnify:CR=1 FL=1